jgi:Coenzyme PQQ synthesis protein D (PqqD)
VSPAAVPADDAYLFVVDDEALFFSEARQELYLFNTPATFVWCCLEEGQDCGRIVAAYAAAFDIPVADAERAVADLLHQWWALGYLAQVDAPPPSPVGFVAALGRLLTNPELRSAFRRSPDETARRLGIHACDLGALVALDPRALEAQAALLAARQSSLRRAGGAWKADRLFVSMAGPDRTLLEAATESRMADRSRPSIPRYYRLLTTTFCLRFSSADEEKHVHRSLAHLEIASPPVCDLVLDVLESGDGHILLQDILPLGFCARLDQLAAFVQVRMRQIAMDRDRSFLHIHAGLVSNGRRGVLLPGAPGRGKTTLTAALIFSGFQYLSDELAVLQGDPLEARAVPVGLAIKPGAVDVLSRLWPEVRSLPIDVREDGRLVRYLAPPRDALAADASTPVGWIVFPRYTRGADTVLRPVRKSEALRRLMAECLVLPNLLDAAGVASLARWIRSVETYELIMDSLAEAVGEVQRLCEPCG